MQAAKIRKNVDRMVHEEGRRAVSNLANEIAATCGCGREWASSQSAGATAAHPSAGIDMLFLDWL
jgi:hypothetical protein